MNLRFETSNPSIAAETPIIVGVGQFTERLGSPDYRALSPSDIAAEAAKRALADALSVEQLAGAIDVIATTRTFDDSRPGPAPFGSSNNFPRSVASRLGICPERAVWEVSGGNTPQKLINEFFEQVAAGRVRMALLAGAEAISTARHAKKNGTTMDWSEIVEGNVDDRGCGRKISTQYQQDHKLVGAPAAYGLCENARRARLRISRDDYRRAMGRLFVPFSRIAAPNPYSAAPHQEYCADELTTVSAANRMIADPYPRRLVSRDQVNQGAAVLITSVGTARELGIPPGKWVFLHGYGDVNERELMEREDLGASPAARIASKAALSEAGIGPDDIRYFDFYSCFPVPVFNAACDSLRLAADDPRGLTVTGGLPFFGGPGNNYSMHAVATITGRLRADPGQYGFVGANGGFMSMYSVGIYSTKPERWKACDSRPHQETIDSLPGPQIAYKADGSATIETYTVVYQKGKPAYAIVVGRLVGDGKRFLANNDDRDRETLARFVTDDPLGARIFVRSFGFGNRFTFSESRMKELFPQGPAIQSDRCE